MAVDDIRDAFSLDMLLSRDVTSAESVGAISSALRQGRLVIIRDAFRPAFADRVHASLDGIEDWPVHEGGDGGHFRFHHHNLYDASRFPDELTWCDAIYRSESTRAFVTDLSGRDCSGPVAFSAACYLPGDYSLPHSDHTGGSKDFHRQVAYVWHLTRDWRTDWGGDFYWCPAQRSFSPSYNTLLLFNVDPANQHFVSMVSPFARSKRLAVNGWWTGPLAAPRERQEPPAPDGPVEVV